MPSPFRIVLNDCVVSLDGVAPTTTLLDWLRGPAGLRGTKEGCAEGDCGACTVLREHENEGRVVREPIVACLAMVGQLAGLGVRTVEGLRAPDGTPHPVQRAMAESDGTQCGFCTPGFVMSLAAFVSGGEAAESARLHDALAGNLCRCTGYRPIVEAAQRSVSSGDPLAERSGFTLAALHEVADAAPASAAYWAPRDLGSLLALRTARPDAVLLAGGTDLGLLASRDRTPPAAIIDLGRVPELQRIEEGSDSLTMGAAVPYARLLPFAERRWPALAAFLTRLGSRQIRSLGTLGGNLGTASPIGDALPVLLALEATIGLRSQRGACEVAIDSFFTGYRRTVLAADEVIEWIRVPYLWPGEIFYCDKVSKRRDQDISAVCGAYRLRIEGGMVRDARIAFGGVAAMPVRAAQAEAAVLGAPWSEATITTAIAALAADIAPIDDARAGADYRLIVAGNLLRRLWLRSAHPGTPFEVDAL